MIIKLNMSTNVWQKICIINWSVLQSGCSVHHFSVRRSSIHLGRDHLLFLGVKQRLDIIIWFNTYICIFVWCSTVNIFQQPITGLQNWFMSNTIGTSILITLMILMSYLGMISDHVLHNNMNTFDVVHHICYTHSLTYGNNKYAHKHKHIFRVDKKSNK